MNIGKDAKRPTCLGAGTFPLDNLIEKHSEGHLETIYQHVGGTCGNVMSIPAWMSWHTLPAARLDDSEVGYQIKADLESYGCDTRHLTNTPDGGTTILEITHKTGRDGKPKTSYRAHSPRGSSFVNHLFLTRQQAQALFGSLEQMPDVFFFDRCAPGNILLARLFHEQGVLVYYEPNEPVDQNFIRAVEVSDIVKFSDERQPDVAFTEAFTDKLFIQTMNERGLRFKLRDDEWFRMLPEPNPNPVDGEGAGDWTTSVFINQLARYGVFGHGASCFDSIHQPIVYHSLKEAQRVASESFSFIGAKGLIHH